MKINRIIAGLVILSSVFTAESKPGDVYTLTGQEKSIEEIVKADMENYPDLYKGESYTFYVPKFKRENNIGNRKLAIGDELIFPETKASIEAKVAARRLLLIGKWQFKKKFQSTQDSIKSVEATTVIEFKDNGEYIYKAEFIVEVGQKKRTETMQGTWIMEGDIIKIEDESQKSKREVEHTVILLTEDKLHIESNDSRGIVKKYKRIK